MNKEQVKTILSVREQISAIFLNFPDAQKFFDGMCEKVIKEWVKPGAYLPDCEVYSNPELGEIYNFNAPVEFYGRVDFAGRTIRIKTEGKEYMIDIDAARKAGLATEVQS